MTEPAAGLADAIEAAISGVHLPGLSGGARRLMAVYRSGELPTGPVMSTRADASAYAAYRMPATVAAAAAAVCETSRALPGWAPSSAVDFGAGTGGVAWAVARELPGLSSMTLLEQSPEAVAVGSAILRASESSVLRTAAWRSWRLAEAGADAAAGLPAADLATAGYVLGELAAAEQTELVALMARTAPAVVLIEPGTPAGYRRILAARNQLLDSGHVIVAPCPHQVGCPLAGGDDWCHFAARLPRSAVHRQVKGGDLGFEDEKFSYVAAVLPAVVAATGPRRALAGRIVRRPQQRKGLVTLDLCADDGTSRRELVPKSRGDSYRRARKASWGDGWDR